MPQTPAVQWREFKSLPLILAFDLRPAFDPKAGAPGIIGRLQAARRLTPAFLPLTVSNRGRRNLPYVHPQLTELTRLPPFTSS